MFLRAAAAAALALLISGDAARLGWDAVQPWHLFFPYFWLFLLLEAARPRRRIDDGVVFLAGAAMAMLYGGVYAKDLQHGFHPLGVDWLGIPCALFDWGMTSVLALHLAARLNPRVEEDGPQEPGLAAFIALVFGFGGAIIVYGVNTAFNYYRADRMLGPTWLLADILFAWAAWSLAKRARLRAEDGEAEGREAWIWAVAAFAVWLPGARIVARTCAMIELPTVLLYFFVGVWTAGAVFLARMLWNERAHFDVTPLDSSRPARLAGLWRIIGTLVLVAWLGADLNDARAGGIFSAAIDWPSRALFAWAFLTSTLKV